MFRFTQLVVRATLCLAILCLAAASASAAELPREARLAADLTGATLVGKFTITGQEQLAPQTERYELTSVKHLDGDNWLFVARIQYGEHDVTLPIALPILWAGETPVITVDNLGFPGLGTYSARVMIYQDHYAGFWNGADHGGHLFGVVERGDAAKQVEAKAAEK